MESLLNSMIFLRIKLTTWLCIIVNICLCIFVISDKYIRDFCQNHLDDIISATYGSFHRISHRYL